MARDYVFTAWKQPEYDESGIRYICWGLESCPTTGREHYQGFAIFNRTYRIPGAKRLIGGGDDCHLEPRRGTRDQAREYCRKDGRFYEFGEFNGLTKEELFKKKISYLKENYPEFYCRYHKGLERLQDKGPKWRDVNVTWLWGASGSGKTRFVMEMDDVYKIDPPYKWWDGYEGEDILLIDDYDSSLARGYLLNILDGYRLRLETKGSHTWALWTKVYITSNKNPTDDLLDSAIRRRVSDVREVTV